MSICRDLLLVKKLPGLETAEPLKCRSWSCEVCAPLRRLQLTALAASGNPNTFITLTSNPAYGQSAAHRARMLVAAWRIIRRWAADMPGNGTVPFLAVFEATKLGQPHLHILCRSKWIDQKWLSRKAEQLVGAKVVWISRVGDGHSPASYIAKYCGKDPHRFDTVKRYWHSKDYECQPYEREPLDDQDRPTVSIFKGGIDQWINDRVKDGLFAWSTQKGAIAWRIFDGSPQFPRCEPSKQKDARDLQPGWGGQASERRPVGRAPPSL